MKRRARLSPVQPVRARGVLAGLVRPEARARHEPPLAELARLAETAGVELVGELSQKLAHPAGATWLGRGKVDELRELVQERGADLAVMDGDLSPAQVRNLEKRLGCDVIDRTELILLIFARRAASAQAKLQVELAQLEYALPRLRRLWTHLERQTGGIGVRGGPGERQIEVDRRVIRRRLMRARAALARVADRRRRLVRSREAFTASLVGYTNAGKSTLLNRLTGADAFIEDRLFATLETRTRKLELGGGKRVLLSDTVGFIRDLPHHLVASFHATLEEAREADLLLHVVDLSHPDWPEQVEVVEAVLDEIGAQGRPTLLVFNKTDLAGAESLAHARVLHPDSAGVSGRTGEGLDALRRAVGERLLRAAARVALEVPARAGRAFAFIAEWGEVLGREELDGGTGAAGADPRFRVECRLRPRDLERLLALGEGVAIESGAQESGSEEED